MIIFAKAVGLYIYIVFLWLCEAQIKHSDFPAHDFYEKKKKNRWKVKGNDGCTADGEPQEGIIF